MLTLAFIAGCIVSPVAIVFASQWLSRSDDARDFAIPSHIAIGDEP